ncbi:MAG TPA: FAD-binding oxidoreductase [Acetobacteraceae bacterium]|nr:FAD-binding oxidoreductase [Acetobacteraceae bacterium]
MRVWNADQQNRSHTLSMFFPDADEVPNGGIEDGKAWIEARIEELIEDRYDAVLDVGGGATGFSRLVQEVPVLEAMEGSAVRVVGLFCIGPEKADLDYLEQFAEVDRFMPAASVIVLNTGLVLSGRSAGGAFKPVLAHPAIKGALAHGAKVAMMPALTCMAQVTDRGLTFAEAMDGRGKDGGEPLSLFDRARVNRWWTRDVPDFFDQLPREWLPTARVEAQPSDSEAG